MGFDGEPTRLLTCALLEGQPSCPEQESNLHAPRG